ncbi:MAG: hypothetical protein NT033_07465 [Candidatus Omnitrophica bacterium]|nr:hypothetical protein [Candidatus Omnitrophota bacterium]
MFIHMNKRGQSTLEYAVVIAVIVGALLATQVYFKRGIQGKFKQSADDIGAQFSPGASKYDYTTTSTMHSSEKVEPGAGPAAQAPGSGAGYRGDKTTTTSDQLQDRSGTEKVEGYASTGEYWGKQAQSVSQ